MPPAWRFSRLVRYDEVYGAGEITHAFRFSTARDERLRLAGNASCGIDGQRTADGHVTDESLA